MYVKKTSPNREVKSTNVREYYNCAAKGLRPRKQIMSIHREEFVFINMYKKIKAEGVYIDDMEMLSQVSPGLHCNIQVMFQKGYPSNINRCSCFSFYAFFEFANQNLISI